MRIVRIENSTPNTFKWLVRDSTNGLVHGIDSVVQEYAAKANFPASGTPGTIYVDQTTGKIYRFDTSTNTYKLISGDALDVNLTSITYVPTATGNTQNLNSLVVDPNGDIWIIDSEGDAKKLNVAQTITTITNTLTSNTTREKIGTYTNEAGAIVDIYASKGLDVITTVQPTPTATGNTTNLNSTFKDANGDTWIVDSNGDAIKAGSSDIRYSKALFVDPINGSDTSGTGSDNNMFKTIAKALSVADGSGFRIVLAPGVYNESPTISLANIDIVTLAGTDRGNTSINGTVTFTHTSSSSGIQGVAMTNLVHSGAGALYVMDCQVNVLLNKTSTGYIEITDTQLQGTSTSTLSAGTGLIKDSLIKNMTISGASSGYTLKSNIIDADGTVTFTGGAFYNIQDNSGNIITTAGTNMETGLIAQGLSSALAKQYVTDFSNKLGMINPDTNNSNTNLVSWNTTTKRLEVSALPAQRTEVLDEFNATAGQTSFTLTQTPIGAVKMTRNGVLLPKAAWTVSGTTVTYVPANNNNNAMILNDRVEFFYETLQ